ncbi:MAG: bifunctional salicylyl-CoA 5-hydroxylase/oxidoreductase [Acidobacteria bacterium]|nr:MAG: bifunctional salicylyl-CoA 5-hydroxylase/oxidoreductase [Acidobacteriota bacterium]REK03344.1 MAG: bifunctional salicylyl-CoA 5-hydroxylase/oxidoreductase [Acidobacteriota bacterium]
MNLGVVGGGPGGLYLALLVKKRWPRWRVRVFERNQPGDTFGFGVVFSDETLGFLRDHDQASYEAIRRNFAYWDDVEIVFRGSAFRVAGNGFAGCSRASLLRLLEERCTELGVEIEHGVEIEPDPGVSPLAGCDLVVAADGINSRFRTAFAHDFGVEVDERRNPFCWLGSTREFDAFEYFFRRTAHGPIVAHCYQYEPGRSTWVIEATPEAWHGLGFDHLDDQKGEHIPVIEEIFGEELAGHRLIDNRSIWRRFPTIRCERWVRGNLCLLGDAKATAHYSIGSGTKLAMEDAIALFEALIEQQPHLDGDGAADRRAGVAAALARYQELREEEVGKTQHAADVSLRWFEAMERHWDLDPEQFAFGVMSRSKQITYENLQLRDERFTDAVDEWFRSQVRREGHAVASGTPPMFTPLRLRDLVIPNRVVVSPMAQYSARDGVPDDWHFQHLASRALGGAGLVVAEMTCPSPEARITPGCTGLWNDEQTEAWSRIAEFIHRESHGKLCMQLGHAGRKGSTQLGWEEMDQPLVEGNWPLVSASPLPYHEGVSQMPAELDRAGMREVTEQFVRAAERADAAGFDLLELHMAHGYLLASFISPLLNRRTDEYGGDIDGRMRFPLEVFAAVRAVWPAGKPMSVRISASDWAEGGLTEEDVASVGRLLAAAGCDLVDVSTGQTVPWQKPVYGRMYQTPFADLVRHEAEIATMAVGNITTADQVNTILLQGRADLVAIARHHLSNPSFTNQAAAWYAFRGHPWPKQYWPGRDQAFHLAARDREQWREDRRALKPSSHRPDERTEDAPEHGVERGAASATGAQDAATCSEGTLVAAGESSGS